MRRIVLAVVSAVLLGLVAEARADEAKDVITRAIKAHGGKDVLKKYQAAQSKNTGKLHLPSVGAVDFTQEVAYMLPDKFKESMDMEIGGMKINVVTINNGDKISLEANGKAVEINDGVKKVMKDAVYLLKLARLTGLIDDKATKLETLGEVTVEEKPAVGVRVSSKGQKDVNLYFYKDSGLVAKLEYRSVDPTTEKECTEERIVVEYTKKKQNGMFAPKKVLIKHDGKTFLEAEVDVKYLEKLDASEFEK